MTRALVTGAAGFVGSHLAEALLDAGYVVRGIDNFETGRRSNLAPLQSRDGFTFREGDVRDPETVATLVTGVDHVFHQAAIASVPRSVENPVAATDVNCTGTATVLDAARSAGVDTVVVASSAAVYGADERVPKVETMRVDPESPYALSKYVTETLAVQASDLYDLDAVALRYFNVFGPRQDPDGDYAAVIPTFASQMLDGERPVVYGDGQQSRDFIYVDDVVRANRLAAEGEVSGEVLNVGRGVGVTVMELVDALNDQLGTALDPVFESPRPGDVRHSRADVTKAGALLGFEPEVSFEEGLGRTLAGFRERRPSPSR